MSASKPDFSPRRFSSPAATLRKLGLVLLLGGFAIGGAIYAYAPAESPKDPLLTEFYDQQDRAAERMWGNQGSLILSLVESLKHARTYSCIVAIIGGLGAFACFFFARDSYDGGNEDQTPALRQSLAETAITTANAEQNQRPVNFPPA